MKKPETEQSFGQILDLLSEQSYALSVAGMDLGRSRLGNVNQLTVDVLTGLEQKQINQDDLLPLRVIYYWAWRVANEKERGELFPYADTDIGKQVLAIANWLDGLVDREEAARVWAGLESSPHQFERYYSQFAIKVRDKLRFKSS